MSIKLRLWDVLVGGRSECVASLKENDKWKRIWDLSSACEQHCEQIEYLTETPQLQCLKLRTVCFGAFM